MFDRATQYLTAFLGLCFLSLAQAADTPDPLFQSDDLLQVRITTQLETLLKERPFESELNATFELLDGAEPAQAFDIQIRTRGRYRRRPDICRFPPMRLNFKKSTTHATFLDNQDKLKLVTHCMSSKNYEQNVLREYAAYRILNHVTDVSFRVRLLRITYIDSENAVDEITRLAFVIEHQDRLAERLGVEVLDIPRTTVAALNTQHTNLVSLFHYMIGNTDFSPIRGAPDEACCHNHVLLGDEDGGVWSVPYDFDQSGLVNAAYATPNPRFGLRSVRQRLYRGRCANNAQIAATISRYHKRREDILATLDTLPELENSTRRQLRKYAEEFFAKFETEKRVARDLVANCV